MNSKLRTQLFISTALTIVLGFGAGFYVGNGSISFRHTQAGEQVDMTAFWKAWDVINENYVSASTTATVSDEDKVYGAISGLVQSLGDPYTVFFTPQEKNEFDENIEGKFEGIGMEVGLQDGLLTVVAPLKNSPAQKAGIESGDIVMFIDGKDTVNLKIEEAVRQIRGSKGTIVTLGIIKKGTENVVDIQVTRDQINVPTLEVEEKGDVYIIKLYSFGANSKAEFKTAITQFAKSGKSKLILDMRGNPGGFLDAAVDISSWFLPAGKTIVSEDFGADTEAKEFRSKGYGLLKPGYKMIVLIDEGSASASEIVAGALKEHGVARIVGTKSYGKGSVQQLIDITPETAIKVTIAQWLTPNGNSISHTGILPDVDIKHDVNAYKKDGTDTQMQKALELLK